MVRSLETSICKLYKIHVKHISLYVNRFIFSRLRHGHRSYRSLNTTHRVVIVWVSLAYTSWTAVEFSWFSCHPSNEWNTILAHPVMGVVMTCYPYRSVGLCRSYLVNKKIWLKQSRDTMIDRLTRRWFSFLPSVWTHYRAIGWGFSR